MKKVNILVLVVTVSLIVMGAGYAAWTQQFDVQATVDTGELKMTTTLSSVGDSLETFVNKDGYTQMSTDKDAPYMSLEMLETTGDELEFQINDMYPGSYFAAQIYAKNEGTIAVKLKDLNLTTRNKKFMKKIDLKYMTYIGKDGVFRPMGQYESIEELLIAFENVQIEPQEEFGFYVMGKFKSKIGKKRFENKKAVFTTTLDFVQFNK